MGAAAVNYVMRKLATRSGAEHEADYYDVEPMSLAWPRPCYCEWSQLRAHLLGEPPRSAIACACLGAVPFIVPGYSDPFGRRDEEKMRAFARQTPA